MVLNSDFDAVTINITAVEVTSSVQQSQFTFKVRKVIIDLILEVLR